jgi:hypothetical protein
MTERFGTSLATISRHKSHSAQAIRRASERREERVGENLLEEMRRVQRKAWELLSKTESEGDHRGSIVALREVRGCLESLGEMLAKADTASGGSPQSEHFDPSLLSDAELDIAEALIAKATGRQPRKLETLARIAEG